YHKVQPLPREVGGVPGKAGGGGPRSRGSTRQSRGRGGTPSYFRFAGSNRSSRGPSIFCRDRMISISFFRPLGGPIMIAPTSRSSRKNSFRKNRSSNE